MFLPQDRVLFGAAYYFEYQPTDTLKVDLDLMVDAGFNTIRVGESVWSTWEPDEGIFDLDWLQPVLDAAHARGLSAILGTPTYAVPPWLARLYPEINAERPSGQRIGWGARQEVDYTHPAFRFHAERMVRNIVRRYADHPAIVGYQVDNEPGLQLFHNHGVFQRFVDHLRRKYETVESLNEEWGLVYWSHRLATWADLWTPDGNAQPQYELAWRQFQGQLTAEFIGWQADIVREYAAPNQFITTCLAYDRPAMDDWAIAEHLDVTSANAYYEMQDGLALPDQRLPAQTWKTDGTWALYLSADRMYSSRQEPFLVTETNASNIGMAWDSRPAYDGQWRQTAWALVSRGASMIGYWHWHTLTFGTETYWGGVLPHSGTPSRTYEQVARVGAELRAAGDVVAGVSPEADVAIVFSMPSRWLMQKFPALCHADGTPDERAYQGLFEPFYRGAFDSGLQTRVIHERQLLAAGAAPPMSPEDVLGRSRVLIAPGLYIAGDETLDWLLRYAEAGGHLILGPRTGYADLEARARTEQMPALLSSPAGVRYDEFSNLVAEVPVTGAGELHLNEGSAATRWVDGLEVADASPLAHYEHPHFGRWPAVTTKAVGAGRITVVGTVPNQAMAESLLRWAAGSGPAAAWSPTSDSVTVTRAVAADGRRLAFVHNWSWEAAQVTAPVTVRDVVSGEIYDPAGSVPLVSWDVRVFVDVLDPMSGGAPGEASSARTRLGGKREP